MQVRQFKACDFIFKGAPDLGGGAVAGGAGEKPATREAACRPINQAAGEGGQAPHDAACILGGANILGTADRQPMHLSRASTHTRPLSHTRAHTHTYTQTQRALRIRVAADCFTTRQTCKSNKLLWACMLSAHNDIRSSV
eukprot:1148290-Pelagomonas_calceolata.AAC.2